ncbi:hypothetical protein OOK44_17885 [Streptomyces cellulosae]|jgi:hypothetical protein|uniref:Muconolactone isomerase domain-containing protein n=2 Tax=Streptomyces TaxID=1883 RepID=A0ABU3J5T4_9ACTN|nr:hypothetical protein [Streptomyces sp. McG7]MBT2906636.1 hypothetical protein [Streptomyces sp. McG8]MCX4478292.1 hypothetical protein [Streptomyces cellulosae]MDQ0486728.1 hypothetical protein [Streptomyces thermodiastaticus]MDT6970420.1 hypothetical protein [Streptomyces thermocarboxydus]MDX3414856.1 hypothetical protein [Streptomyces sp. MD20-1-1]MXQ62022.1 hypothetical protein [Streptomyces sp. XHT-2]MYQ36442.1 hypothetical protein [Streptomyces sp. SID4956]MYW53448.1 hypothetical pr
MRVMLKATLDTEKSNEAIRSGKLPEMMQETIERLHPEAAYFGPLGGRRTCLLVLDVEDSSQIPPIGEPFFSQFDAEVEMTPVMNADDLRKGLSELR